MFTFSLTSFLAPCERAANQIHSGLSLVIHKLPKASGAKRVRRSKFYKHQSGSVFGATNKYLLELKDGRVYYTYLDGRRELVKNYETTYQEFRSYIKKGLWEETTMEQASAAQSS